MNILMYVVMHKAHVSVAQLHKWYILCYTYITSVLQWNKKCCQRNSYDHIQSTQCIVV